MSRPSPRRTHGFTLVEVLAALLFIGIVLPVIMQGITLSTNVASVARKKTEAAGLAQAKLAELAVSGQWESGNTSGDFGDAFPGYRWEASADTYVGNSAVTDLVQLEVRVIWRGRGGDESVALTTLVRSTGL